MLALSATGMGAIVGEQASPWSWGILGLLGVASLLASIANFGDVVEVDDTGLTHENTLLRPVGLSRGRRAEWKDVLHAVDQDGATFFIEVQDQRRWVVDQLDNHEHFRLILEDRGISVSTRTRPRLAFWRRDHSDGR